MRSDQCPYLEDAARIITQFADEMGIQKKVIELKNCHALRKKSPSPYGVFNVVYEGKLLSYHYLTKKELQKRLEKLV